MWPCKKRRPVEEGMEPEISEENEASEKKGHVKHSFMSMEDTWEEMAPLPVDDRIFFDHLFIASDGGMDELGDNPAFENNIARQGTAAALVLFVVYNILAIIAADIVLMTEVDPKPPQYLLSASLLSPLLQWYGIKVGHLPKRVAGAGEAFCLAMRCLETYIHWLNIKYDRGYQKYRSIVVVAWELLPDLSIFSCLRLLQYVVPQQAIYDANVAFFYDMSYFNIVFFVVSRPFCLICGFDFLLIKIRLVRGFIDTVDASIIRVAKAGIFLCQMLGVVQISKAVKIRLYRFIFGGEDGIMQEEEKVRQEIWEAMVVQEIIRCYEKWHAITLILTFCDDDFQLLSLNENSNKGAAAQMKEEDSDGEDPHDIAIDAEMRDGEPIKHDHLKAMAGNVGNVAGNLTGGLNDRMTAVRSIGVKDESRVGSPANVEESHAVPAAAAVPDTVQAEDEPAETPSADAGK